MRAESLLVVTLSTGAKGKNRETLGEAERKQSWTLEVGLDFVGGKGNWPGTMKTCTHEGHQVGPGTPVVSLARTTSFFAL